MQLQFEMVVKDGLVLLATVTGRPRPTGDLKVSDLEKVMEVEQYLERLFGYRFHINQEVR